jgi:host factor-I protein
VAKLDILAAGQWGIELIGCGAPNRPHSEVIIPPARACSCCLDRARIGGTTNVMKTNTEISDSALKDALSLQDAFLSDLSKQQNDVTFFLVNGVRLTGKVAAFDRFVVLVQDSVTQMVYKHAISTIVPNLTHATASSESQAGKRAPEIVRRPRPRAVAAG